MVLSEQGGVDGDFCWGQCWSSDKFLLRALLAINLEARESRGLYQRLVTNKLTCQPQEWFLEVVVGFGGNVIVLQILLAMEGDGLCFDFALLDIHLIPTEDDRNVFADTDEVT